jgi:Carboxypeptidase regulatory-like domain
MIARGPLIVLATGAFSAFAYGADVGSSTLAGKVSFSGTTAPPQKVKLAADPKCAALHPDGLEVQPVKVKDGGLADVLVYVKSALASSYPAPTEPVLLDQSGCEYHPRMVVLMVGQPLQIRNSDPTLHNIHPRPTVNREFNIGQPRQGMQSTRTFDAPELLIPTACEVHPWMRAYISVLAHPFFAVTKEDGSYEIRGLPDGDYEVEAVHSQLKSMTGKVTVKDGKTSKLDFTFKLVQL